jgi:hypothetical protein
MKRIEWTDRMTSVRIGDVAGDLRVRGLGSMEVAVQERDGHPRRDGGWPDRGARMGDLVLRVCDGRPLEGATSAATPRSATCRGG